MRKIVRNTLIVFFIGVFLVSAWKLFDYWHGYWVSTKTNQELADAVVEVVDPIPVKPENNDFHVQPTDSEENSPIHILEGIYAPIKVDFETLLKQNPDVVAWIYNPQTTINYPVMQAEDNAFYLHRMLNGEYSYSGSLFMDYRNEEDFSHYNTILYGHHMRAGSMFAPLCDYKDQDYYNEHPVMYILTPEHDYVVVLAAGYLTSENSLAYTVPMDQKQKNEFLDECISKSTFRSDVELSESDKLVSLSTCSYEFKDARYIVVGILKELDRR